MRPALPVIEGQLDGRPAAARNDKDLGVVPSFGFKGEELSVWRPARESHQFAIESQLFLLSTCEGSCPNIDRSAFL